MARTSASKKSSSSSSGAKPSGPAAAPPPTATPPSVVRTSFLAAVGARGYAELLVTVALLSWTYSLIASAATRAAEPLYGAVLAHRHAEPVAGACLVFAWVGARVAMAKRCRGAVDAHAAHALRRTVAAQLALAALLLAAAPITRNAAAVFFNDPLRYLPQLVPMVPAWLSWAQTTWLQPHLAHLTLLYPVAALAGATVAALPYLAAARARLTGELLQRHVAFARALVPLAWFASASLSRSLVPELTPHQTLAALGVAGALVALLHGGKRAQLLASLAVAVVGYCAASSRVFYPHLANVSLAEGYTLVEKRGHIQVLKDSGRDILFLRAGHSMLGGVYTSTMDSVFSGFYLHDMHRLVKDRSPQKRALMIGYGMGIAAAGAAAADHALDVVEIDRDVLDLAREHFPILPPTTPVAETTEIVPAEGGVVFHVADGLEWLQQLPDASYDYVVHDVFSGGTIAPALFSYETFAAMRRVLVPGGTASVNFVGIPHSPVFRRVARTLRAVFPYVACHAERTDQDRQKDEVTNLVFWGSTSPIHWRAPLDADFMGSEMRWYSLTHAPDLLIAIPPKGTSDVEYFGAEAPVGAPVQPPKGSNATRYITDADHADLAEMLVDVALAHWRIMREIVPVAIWAEY